MPTAPAVNETVIENAIETFVRGFCRGKSATYPYEPTRIGKVWVMRDAPRKNPRYYRKEEWIGRGIEPADVDAVARRHTRGRFFVCPVVAADESEDGVRGGYKSLGYRLLASEEFFIHRLQRIARIPASTIAVTRIRTRELAERFGKATRSKPMNAEQLGADAAFRQYVALDGDTLVGWVRSTMVGRAAWCSHMYVRPSHRRQGIGRGLLARMLRDDRGHGATRSVLLASKTGALVYPRLGYERIGTLLIFAPPKRS